MSLRWYPAIAEYGSRDEVYYPVMDYVRLLKREDAMRDDFKTAGQCPNCKAIGLVSFIHHDIEQTRIVDNIEYESCAEWCAYCDFGAGTWRVVMSE